MRCVSGWIKYFRDGTSETGFDHEVKARTASWRHGLLDDIESVCIRHGILCAILHTPLAKKPQWWQSDTLTSTFVGMNKKGLTNYVKRRMQYLVTEDDIGLPISLECPDKFTYIYCLGYDRFDCCHIIGTKDVGKWLTIELDIQYLTSNMLFSDSKI